MYQAYWNLKGKPFDDTFSKDIFFMSQGHEEGLARLRFFSTSAGRVANLAGKPGAGKSFVAHLVKQTIEEMGMRVAMLSYSDPDPVELLQTLLWELGLDHSSHDRVDLWKSFEHFIKESVEVAKSSVILILDSADLVSKKETFNELRTLLDFTHPDARGHGKKPLKLLLITERPIPPRSLKYGPLAARVDFRYSIPPVTPLETHAYVKHRLALSGGSPDTFCDEALDVVFKRTDGVPRKINFLCDLCLLLGATEKAQRIDAALVRHAADELVAHVK